MIDQPNDGGPIAPEMRPNEHGGLTPHYGMTLRDYFAGQALIAILAGRQFDTMAYNLSLLPDEAFKIADAMLAARAEKNQPPTPQQ